jgi:hypothetical protein
MVYLMKFRREDVPFKITLTPYFNPIPLTIPKLPKFKLLNLMRNLQQSKKDHEKLSLVTMVTM